MLGKVRLYNNAFNYQNYTKDDGITYKQRGAVHEFGHMMGLRDEYPEGNEYEHDYDSIMNSGESLRSRHFSNIQNWINDCCEK